MIEREEVDVSSAVPGRVLFAQLDDDEHVAAYVLTGDQPLTTDVAEAADFMLDAVAFAWWPDARLPTPRRLGLV